MKENELWEFTKEVQRRMKEIQKLALHKNWKDTAKTYKNLKEKIGRKPPGDFKDEHLRNEMKQLLEKLELNYILGVPVPKKVLDDLSKEFRKIIQSYE